MINSISSGFNSNRNVPPAQTLQVSPLNGQFISIKNAMDSIIDSSINKPYVIEVYPGKYRENNPIICKPFVTIIGNGIVIVDAQNNSSNVFELGRNSFIENLTVQNATNGIAFNKVTNGNATLQNITIIDCKEGLVLNSNGTLFSQDLILIASSSSFINGVRILSGIGTLINTNLTGISTCTNLFNIDGATSIVTIDTVTSFSPNLDIGILIKNEPRVVVRNISLVGMNKGVKVESGGNLRFYSSVFFNAQTDGLEVLSSVKTTFIGAYAVTVEDSVSLNVNIKCTNCTIIGSAISSDSSKVQVVPGADIYISFIDLFSGDEGLTLLGELHVGNPIRPTESVFGEGDSYIIGMLVYTYNPTGSVFTNVSVEAASDTGSTFTFPGIGVDNAIYIASALTNETDYLKHHGIKTLVDTACVVGSGEIVSEYWNGSTWVEFNCMETEAEPKYLPHAKNYFQYTSYNQIRYDIRMVNNSWTKNDPISPSLGINLFWTRFRVKAAITTAPIFQQFKLHSSRSEFNSDGWFELFGNARSSGQLAWSLGGAKAFEGNVQNQNLYADENIGTANLQNKFTGANDKIGLSAIVPLNIDTSSAIKLIWLGVPNSTEDITFTIRWIKKSNGDTIYFTEPGASGTTKSTTITQSVISDQQTEFSVFLDVSDIIPRTTLDIGDSLWVSIHSSTITGTFTLIAINALYVIWAQGGHI